MIVAVTGGSGQLGTAVLRRLGHDRAVKGIVSLDLRPPLAVDGKIRTVHADVRERGFERHLEGCDALVHLAAIVGRRASAEELHAVNVEGAKNVFRAAVKAGLGAVVYVSSIAAYGLHPGHPVPITEDTPRRPSPGFAYAQTKFEVEAFLDELEREHPAVAVSRLRPSLVLGARMEHALGRAMAKRLLPGVGDAPIPVVWDEDVAEAVLLALEAKARGAFNLSTDDPLPVAELAAAAGMRVVKLPRQALAGAARLWELVAAQGGEGGADPAWIEHARATMVVSSDRAKKELGWKPKVPTAAQVMKRFVDVVPDRTDPKILLFMQIVKLSLRHAPEHELAGFRDSRVHISLTGPGGGDFGLLIQRGKLRLVTEPPRPPTAVIAMRAALFLDLLAGKADFATSQLTGRIRLEGETQATMVVSGMIGMFRARTEVPGARGFGARALARWFGTGRKP